jgi:hypothetical protein
VEEPVWTQWPLGARVTIRRRLPTGGYSDWVGVLEEATPAGVMVRHRDGRVRRIGTEDIAIAHLIPGRPARTRSGGLRPGHATQRPR